MAGENLNRIKVIIVTAGGILGGIWGILEGYDKITERIDATVKQKVIEHSEPLIKKSISHALDSISKAKRISFREGLATEFGTTKDQIITVMGDWFKSEKGVIDIGIKLDNVTNELYYIHTDGKRYLPYRDSSGFFFFYDRNHIQRWCN